MYFTSKSRPRFGSACWSYWQYLGWLVISECGWWRCLWQVPVAEVNLVGPWKLEQTAVASSPPHHLPRNQETALLNISLRRARLFCISKQLPQSSPKTLEKKTLGSYPQQICACQPLQRTARDPAHHHIVLATADAGRELVKVPSIFSLSPSHPRVQSTKITSHPPSVAMANTRSKNRDLVRPQSPARKPSKISPSRTPAPVVLAAPQKPTPRAADVSEGSSFFSFVARYVVLPLSSSRADS